MLGFAQAQILDITGSLEVFARTSRWLRDHQDLRFDAYEIELVAPGAGPINTSGDLQLLAARSYTDMRPADTLLIAGGLGYAALLKDRELLNWIRREAGKVSRIGSICTGALVLAAAGLLGGKRATTHWAYCDALEKLAPDASFSRYDPPS